MRRNISLIILFAFCLGLSLSLVACFGKPPKEMTYEELLREGRKRLEENKGAQAYNFYLKAHRLKPDESEPLWGLVVSNGQRMIANLDGTIDILWGVYVYEPQFSECVAACERLSQCDKEIKYGIFKRIRSSEETCLKDCPWGLQPYMFEAITECEDCECVRKKALEWIISISPADCELLCNDLELCGLIRPPRTFDLAMCKERCPRMYVEHHTDCYMEHLGECSRKDRTCFEHTVVGLQELFKRFGARIPPDLLKYADVLLTRPGDQFYLKTHSWVIKEPPMELILDGRFGQPELHFYRAFAHFFGAFVLLMTAMNLDINTVTGDLHFDYYLEDFSMDAILANFNQFLFDLTDTLENTLYDPIFPGALIIKGWDKDKDEYEYVDECKGFDDVDACIEAIRENSLKQFEEGGIELGLMFGEFAQFIYTLMNDTDRQKGKAIGYDDKNENFHWDTDETLTFRGLNITLTYEQALRIADMCKALENNLVNRVPFDVNYLLYVIDSFDNWLLGLIVKWIAKNYLDNGQIDISELFYNPDPMGLRELVVKVIDILYDLQAIFSQPNGYNYMDEQTIKALLEID